MRKFLFILILTIPFVGFGQTRYILNDSILMMKLKFCYFGDSVVYNDLTDEFYHPLPKCSEGTYHTFIIDSNYFMVFPKNPEDSIDIVLTHVEHVIKVNIEKENKLVLLKAKIEELKQLFTNKSLNELEKLKFVIQEVSEPTLKDLDTNPQVGSQKSRHVSPISSVELPPKDKSLNGKLEKEEN